MHQIFGTKPEADPIRGHVQPTAGTINHSNYMPMAIQANNPQVIFPPRVPVSFDNNSTYATVQMRQMPPRGAVAMTGQEHNQMPSQMSQQYRKPLYHANMPQQMTSYPTQQAIPPNNSLNYVPTTYPSYSNQQQGQSQYNASNGPQTMQQQRHLGPNGSFIHTSWNQSGVVQVNNENHNHKDKSPSNSTSSGDSLNYQHPQVLPPPPTPSSTLPIASPSVSASTPSFTQNYYVYKNRGGNLSACVGENDTELSFEPNMIIVNGKNILQS
jgi:hypothetical protein